MKLGEPVDDIQRICLRLRAYITDDFDRLRTTVAEWEPAPYPDGDVPVWQADDPELLPRPWFR